MKILLGKGGKTSQGWHHAVDGLACLKRFQLRAVRGVGKPSAEVPEHFAVGLLFHAGRARWFSQNFATTTKAWDSIRDAVKQEIAEQELPVPFAAEKRAMRYLQEYVEHWRIRPKPVPVAAEYLLGPAPLAPNDPLFMYRTARLDDVSRYDEAGGALCIGESKTTSTSIHDCAQEYQVHGQPMLQFLLWKLAPQGEREHGPVKGVVLDVTVKGSGNRKSSFGRVFIPVTEWQVQWFTDSMRGYLRAMEKIDWNSEVPRNPSQCSYTAGRMRVACEFRDLCQFGKSASAKYTFNNGSSILKWKKEGRTVPPWK